MLCKKYSGFFGGIHPADGSDKELSLQSPIVSIAPGVVEISSEQSTGSVCHFQPAIGDKVNSGELIGIPKSFTAVNLHASISGTVTDLKTYEYPRTGAQVTFLRIEGNGREAVKVNQEYRFKLMDISYLSRETLRHKMKEGGLTGMGGAGFPTHIKYETKHPIDMVLINAAECEPYLTCDHRLMLEYGMEIINGINLLIKAAGAQKAILCLEDNKKDAGLYLENLISGLNVPINIKLLPTKYPQGGERQLIQAVTNIMVPMGGLPTDIGIIVNNVATAKAMADLVFGDTPLIARCITVTGKVKNPGNYYVPLGTSFSTLLQFAGGITALNNKVILGGPMTGNCIGVDVTEAEVYGSVTKTSSAIIVLENSSITETPCIRCGACSRICPAGINPFKIDNAYLREDLSLCEKLFATECIGCGSCSYVCPAKRELARRNISARNKVKKILRERQVK